MATRKEVADYAGVSVATVSNVVNRTKYVSDEVRQRVEEARKQLDYRPNMIARSLATKETRHVAIMVDNLKNGYYTEMLEGAQSLASEHGYIVSIILNDFTDKEETLGIASRGLDGVILTNVEAKEIQKKMNQKICMTQYDLKVEVDYKKGIFDAVNSLKQHGHKDIGFLSGLRLSDDGSHPRWDCFRDACKKSGIDINLEFIVDANERQTTDEDAGVEAVRRLFARKTRPTAFIAVNDLMAIGAIRELNRCGFKVPEDISVIGCDNSQASKYYTPSISSIDASVFELGRSMMSNLISAIKGEELKNTVIASKYIERESVADVLIK